MADLENRVRAALRVAHENGFDFTGWSNDAVVVDLMTYSADIETEDEDAVLEAVIKIRGGE